MPRKNQWITAVILIYQGKKKCDQYPQCCFNLSCFKTSQLFPPNTQQNASIQYPFSKIANDFHFIKEKLISKHKKLLKKYPKKTNKIQKQPKNTKYQKVHLKKKKTLHQHPFLNSGLHIRYLQAMFCPVGAIQVEDWDVAPIPGPRSLSQKRWVESKPLASVRTPWCVKTSRDTPQISKRHRPLSKILKLLGRSPGTSKGCKVNRGSLPSDPSPPGFPFLVPRCFNVHRGEPRIGMRNDSKNAKPHKLLGLFVQVFLSSDFCRFFAKQVLKKRQGCFCIWKARSHFCSPTQKAARTPWASPPPESLRWFGVFFFFSERLVFGLMVFYWFSNGVWCVWKIF